MLASWDRTRRAMLAMDRASSISTRTGATMTEVGSVLQRICSDIKTFAVEHRTPSFLSMPTNYADTVLEDNSDTIMLIVW